MTCIFSSYNVSFRGTTLSLYDIAQVALRRRRGRRRKRRRKVEKKKKKNRLRGRGPFRNVSRGNSIGVSDRAFDIYV